MSELVKRFHDPEETLDDEFKRLVLEHGDGLAPESEEAWNLIADFAVENAATIATALAGWRPIETAPMDTNVLMAWLYDGQWEVKSGWAGSTKGAYLHSQATHWRPIPEPPQNVKFLVHEAGTN